MGRRPGCAGPAAARSLFDSAAIVVAQQSDAQTARTGCPLPGPGAAQDVLHECGLGLRVARVIRPDPHLFVAHASDAIQAAGSAPP